MKKDSTNPGDSQTPTGGTGAAIGNSNSLNSSASALQSLLSASTLDKAATGTQFNYSGPNLAAVTATNEKAITSGLSGGFDLNEILTDEDKAVTRYDPNDPNGRLQRVEAVVEG